MKKLLYTELKQSGLLGIKPSARIKELFMGNVYGMAEIQELIKNCKFDEFKNAVHAGEININIEYPRRYGMGGPLKSFSYNCAPDLENAVKWVKLFASLGVDFNNEMLSIINNVYGAELIKTFVELGVDIHRRDEVNRTIMFYAAWRGNVEVVKCLAELGADVNAKNNNGRTAVFSAVSDYKIDSLKCLKSLGADLNIKANDGSTPLSYAKNYPKAAKWLKANGAK
jgi:hypothetical protein